MLTWLVYSLAALVMLAAVAGELPGADWQRCVVHFERNVLSDVPTRSMGEVAEDLKATFRG